MYALVDVNNMYVSCERAFRPSLVGRPVVVLSNNDGCAIARSNEAKDLGIRMAQPWFQIRHLRREAGLIALSANFELYGDMSSRMMTIAGEYAPRQEIYSIDECFLDFEGVRDDLAGIGRELRAKVLRWTGLPTSVGFGPTKTLAKLANHVAKTADRKPGSYPSAWAQVCNLADLNADELQHLMRSTDAGDVWGVGRKTCARLAEQGIRTVHDLAHANPATLRGQFSVVMEKTLRELHGTPCLDVEDAPAANQQIMCSRSFGSPVTEVAALEELVSQFASRVAEKARQQRSVAGAVHVFVSTSPFRKQDLQHSPSGTLPLSRPTADTRVLVGTAVQLVRGMARPGFHYVKAGVMLVDLQPDHQVQAELDLFAGVEEPVAARRDRTQLMGTLDAVNQRFGKGAISVASAARLEAHSGSVAAARQEWRSPRYTTRLDEIPNARA
ncbi:Y-family DNA polymerase [Ideonella sp. YS5]|uniref:Y-family DNA polymerase n=1 Tax=Ideonella sp. YS5 TaxID=3453714 RepID=UPI003EED779E